MKTCSHPGCNYPVFSKGLCKIHWAQKYQKPLKRTPIKKSVTTIAKISDNKKKQDEEYTKICRELEREAGAKGLCVCYFCGSPLEGNAQNRNPRCDHHHIAGKSGLSDNNIPLYLDKDGIVLCHRACHRRYHDITIAELLKTSYYKELMNKIKYICKSKYYNMKSKHEDYVKNL